MPWDWGASTRGPHCTHAGPPYISEARRPIYSPRPLENVARLCSSDGGVWRRPRICWRMDETTTSSASNSTHHHRGCYLLSTYYALGASRRPLVSAVSEPSDQTWSVASPSPREGAPLHVQGPSPGSGFQPLSLPDRMLHIRCGRRQACLRWRQVTSSPPWVTEAVAFKLPVCHQKKSWCGGDGAWRTLGMGPGH